MKGVSIACIAAVSFTVLAADAPPLELKGIRIGDTEADMLKDRASYMVCRGDDPGPFKRICSGSYKLCTLHWPNCDEKFKFGGAVASTIFVGFNDNNTVGTIHVAIKHADFADIVPALIEKYGKPTSDVAGVSQNRMGASFSNRAVSWKTPKGTLLASERANDIDTSIIAVHSTESIAETGRKRENGVKDAAKQL